MMNIDEEVEMEFEAQLAAGLEPGPIAVTVRLTFDVEKYGEVDNRSRIVHRSELESTIERLASRLGAFNFDTHPV